MDTLCAVNSSLNYLQMASHMIEKHLMKCRSNQEEKTANESEIFFITRRSDMNRKQAVE